MPVQAVQVGDQAKDQHYPRERGGQRLADPSSSAPEGGKDRQRVSKFMPQGRANLVVDEKNHIVMIQLLDPYTDQVVQEIAAEDLELHDYHGILVDIDT